MSLLQVLNATQSQAQADAQVQERYDRATGQVDGADPYAGMLGSLDAYIESCWQAAKSAKETKIEQEMLEDLRQRDGEYGPAKLAEIRQQGGSEIYMMLTDNKCVAVESWIRDVLLPSGERPFRVIPEPAPDDLQPEIKQGIYGRVMQELQQAMQSGLYVTPQQVYERSRAMYDEFVTKMREEAKIRASRMEDAIDDKLIEGQWYEALESMVSDLVNLPTAFVKGPVVRKVRKLAWKPGSDGKSMPMAVDELTPIFYSPSALDIFPAPDSASVDDGYLFERIRPRRSAIADMKGMPGYKDEAISAALAEYEKSGYDLPLAGESQRRWINDQRNYQMTPDHAIDGYEFHGSVRGQWLIDWGMPSKEIADPDAEYEVTCLKIGRFVVRCVLNEDPLRRRPYMAASFRPKKGAFWGRGLTRILRDLQTMCNGAARALMNNMGISSGPMAEVEVNRLAEGEDITQMYPWRIFQTKSSNTTPSPAVRFFVPPSQAKELMAVYGFFSKLADDYSGIPSYEQGINPTTGAAGTASGLSMLITAASRQLKRLIASIDKVIEGSVYRMHTHVMLYDDNPDVKGEANIEARGAASLIAKEQQQMRRTQLLSQTANPIDMQILGLAGRAELWREVLRSMDMDPDSIIPTKDEIAAKQKAAASQPPPGQPGAPGGQPPQIAGPPGQPMPQGHPMPQNMPPQIARLLLDHAGNPAGGVSHNLFAHQGMHAH